MDIAWYPLPLGIALEWFEDEFGWMESRECLFGLMGCFLEEEGARDEFEEEAEEED